MLADLARAQRLIRRMGDEIDPQFRIAAPGGDVWIAMTLTDDESERANRRALLSDFMAWKLAPGFVMAAEIAEPDAVFAMGVSVSDFAAAVSLITREPLAFSEAVWIGRDQGGEDLPSLLPRGSRTLSGERLKELDEWFGPAGRFPAVKIAAESEDK
ncbi:hypothetical protein GIW81_08535 [Hyphomicrobium sp. xq]|uniref:Uncharacterized protein n=1 Tax=Hyphomicrobium album TaxID=2665159 RepID=A0A6I3KJ00_9HYPH|nr:hypothetical protein [Hyphomicrobium album]MTD94379.1 hypothetical protein [Hyphomicrobium album]